MYFGMPSQYHIRSFVQGGFYHIFNRGVEKNNIFRDEEDYNVFLYFLESALSPVEKHLQQRRLNFFNEVKLIVYCLMPNHFHMVLQQLHERILPQFMTSFINAYTAYFNQKYKRVGSIFQGRYKAKLIESDEYLLQVSRYIHLNPQDINKDPRTYPYSSLQAYISTSPPWINTNKVFDLLSTDKEKQKELYCRFCFEEDHPFDDPFSD